MIVSLNEKEEIVMSVEKKVAYLKGLAEGLNISENTAEGKMLRAIVDTLGVIADELEGVDEELKQLNEYVEEVDGDLMELEEDFYEDDCDCDDCCDCDDDDCDDDCDCCCDDCDDCDDDEFDYDEYECPQCHEIVSFSGDFAESELVCPNCGASLLEK